MDKKAILIFVMFLFVSIFYSCDRSVGVNFLLSNNTNAQIDPIQIEPNVDVAGMIPILRPGETNELETDMTNIPRVDGAYTIRYLIDGEKKRHQFGYYTNGTPLEKSIKINIEQDTLLIEFDR